MSMSNPAMYAKFIAFQKQDASRTLQRFGSKMKWRKNASVIDLGCGDGFVTTNILQKHLPNDFKKIVGVDISKEMVEYATKKYGNEKIKFGLLDIGGKVPDDFKGAFDHAFSSYAVHFVSDQEKAFSNIYELLKEGGSCLLVFVAKLTFSDVFLTLSKMEKWQPRMPKDIINRVVSRYHTMKDPGAEVTRIMKESGFKDIIVESDKSSFEYDTYNNLLKMIESTNFFNLPPEVHREFIEDFDKVLTEIKGVERVKGKSAVKIHHTPIIAYGTK